MDNKFTAKQSYFDFLKFALPSVITMIFLSFYTTIDGFFVSRYVGSDALAAINIVIPVTCIIFGISVMLATGSGAFVGMELGKDNKEAADSFFSFTTLCLLIIGIVIMILGLVFLKPILIFLGATDRLLEYAIPYGLYTVLMTIPMMFKLYLEYYARIDGSPKLSLLMSFVGITLNVLLDYIFIAHFNMGILGAVVGTYVSMVVSAIIGIWYFVSGRSLLKFCRPAVDFKKFFMSCYNGSSEMFTEFSTGITTYLFNIGILFFKGEDGVAAMSIISYMYYFFIATYFGIITGVSPIISYNYGAKNIDKIRESTKHSIITICWSSIAMFAISYFAGWIIVDAFTDSASVYDIACSGLKLFSLTFLTIGINVFLSGFFTAIGNGSISAIISICRSFLFVVVCAVFLPKVIGINGIWLAMPISELITVFISVPCYFIIARKSLKQLENKQPYNDV